MRQSRLRLCSNTDRLIDIARNLESLRQSPGRKAPGFRTSFAAIHLRRFAWSRLMQLVYWLHMRFHTTLGLFFLMAWSPAFAGSFKAELTRDVATSPYDGSWLASDVQCEQSEMTAV